LEANEHVAKFPHCDQNVLHRKGKCDYCDMYPDLQKLRIKQKINFTGELKPNKEPCPSDLSRGFKQAEKWHGNTAIKNRYTEMCKECSAPAEQMYGFIRCLKGHSYKA
jgi:hypothetical protein